MTVTRERQKVSIYICLMECCLVFVQHFVQEGLASEGSLMKLKFSDFRGKYVPGLDLLLQTPSPTFKSEVSTGPLATYKGGSCLA